MLVFGVLLGVRRHRAAGRYVLRSHQAARRNGRMEFYASYWGLWRR